MKKLRALCGSAAAVVALGASACTPAPAPATPPVAAPAPSAWEAEMLASVNAQRAGTGVGAVSLCGSLIRAAQAHSADQAARRTMSHTGGDGSTLRIRVERAGYLNWTGIAENVAMGYASVPAVMDGWMNSSGHRANLLNGTYTHIGFGLVADSGGALYWTQNFGRSGSC